MGNCLSLKFSDILESAGDIVAPNSRVEVKSIWLTQAGAADTGAQDIELGSLTGTTVGPVRTFQLAAADSSSSPGGVRLLIISMCLIVTPLLTHVIVFTKHLLQALSVHQPY